VQLERESPTLEEGTVYMQLYEEEHEKLEEAWKLQFYVSPTIYK